MSISLTEERQSLVVSRVAYVYFGNESSISEVLCRQYDHRTFAFAHQADGFLKEMGPSFARTPVFFLVRPAE